MKKIKFLDEPENGFYPTLKQRVKQYFKDNNISRYGNSVAVIKSVLFCSTFLLFYFIIIAIPKIPLWLFFSCWFFMGMAMLFTAMSIVHDAAHNAYSKYPWVNQVLLRFTNLAGGDGYMYKYKHTVSHHPYTNIRGYDIDLEQSKVVKVTPYTATTKKHKYQHIYMKILYPGYILFWVLLRDFQYYSMKYIGPIKSKHKTKYWIFLFTSKIFYLFYLLILPIIILPYPFWIIIIGFFLMQI